MKVRRWRRRSLVAYAPPLAGNSLFSRRYTACSTESVMMMKPLQPRELDVVRLAVLGRSNKLIAYELGISISTTGASLTTAYRKLGVRNRAELATLFINRRVISGLGDTPTPPVAPTPPVVAPHLEKLTTSERAIAGYILEGRSNAQIANARGVALRTVANQVASLLRKLGLASRYELLARWAHGPSETVSLDRAKVQ